jgi:hypothetical protein
LPHAIEQGDRLGIVVSCPLFQIGADSLPEIGA